MSVALDTLKVMSLVIISDSNELENWNDHERVSRYLNHIFIVQKDVASDVYWYHIKYDKDRVVTLVCELTVREWSVIKERMTRNVTRFRLSQSTFLGHDDILNRRMQWINDLDTVRAFG